MIVEIRKKEEELREMYESSKNKRRLAYWDNAEMTNDYFKGIPKSKDRKTFCVELERPQYAKLLGFDFYEYYHDPYVHYLSGLQMQIYKFNNFDDCTPIVKRQAVYPSGAFERAIFVGDDASYTEHDAVISNKSVIPDGEDFINKPYPDFHTSGIMPQIIRFYEDICDIASDDFKISFPVWGRSAWGCAWQMRRLENLMYDLADEPEWFNEMLEYLNEARKHWSRQRAEYLGEPLGPENIYNDEVMNPIVGPGLYKEYILPLEIELSDYLGGIAYWHSCGDTSQLFHLINQIPKVQMVTVSAWSDIEAAGRIYNTDKVLEVQLHPVRDVMQPQSENTLAKRLETILTATREHKVNIIGGGLTFYHGYEDGMQRIAKLCETAHKVLDL